MDKAEIEDALGYDPQALSYAWGRNDQGWRSPWGGEADSMAFAAYYLWRKRIKHTTLQEAWAAWEVGPMLTVAQRKSLRELCERYRVTFNDRMFIRGASGLPPTYVAGLVGPIYVGCDDAGVISS